MIRQGSLRSHGAQFRKCAYTMTTSERLKLRLPATRSGWPDLQELPGGSAGEESACHVGDLGSIPGLGRLPGEKHGNPLQYSCLGSPHGQRSLAGYSPWGHRQSDTSEQLSTAQHSLYRNVGALEFWGQAVTLSLPGKIPHLMSDWSSHVLLSFN